MEFQVRFNNNIALISFRGDENWINMEFVNAFNTALDKVLSNESCVGVVTTGGESNSRFYSNGLDLRWMKNSSLDEVETFLQRLNELKIRIVTFPVLTVAAINGHCYAAGAIVALCHDFRIMQNGRGWFCFPEIHIKLRISDNLMKLLRLKLRDSNTMRDCLLLGRQYTAEDAVEAAIVDRLSDPGQLIPAGEQLITQHCNNKRPFDRRMMTMMKQDIYKSFITDRFVPGSINVQDYADHSKL